MRMRSQLLKGSWATLCCLETLSAWLVGQFSRDFLMQYYLFQAIYVIVQKRFIFDVPNSRWRKYPIYVTAYSYFFGAVFMGIGTIYYAASGKYSEFHIPLDVRF